jgi:hypothetical protein
MSNPQRLAVALVFLVALVGGGVVALTLLGGGGATGASPGPVAAGSPSSPASSAPAGSPSAIAEPTEPPSTEPESAEPSESAAPTTPPTPAPTVAPGRNTVVVFTALKLDAKDDPDGFNRKLSFRSQGSGTVNVAIRTISPQGMTVMCLSADGERLACKTTAVGTLTATTTTRKADFSLTLRGDGIFAPVVEVTVTFPARTPSITITNARFDGTLYPETNGLQLFVAPREDGEVTVDAAWGGKPFNYEIDLLEQGGPGTQVLANQGPSTGAQATLPVTTGNPWKLLLQNINDGFGVTLLDATISWP